MGIARRVNLAFVAAVMMQSCPATAAPESMLYPFSGRTDGGIPLSGVIDVGGTLYGTTSSGGTGTTNCSTGCGTVYSVDPTSGAETALYSFQGSGNGSNDGADPQASLLNVGGLLYGTTAQGGADTTNCSTGCGTVFSVDPTTGTETVLYSFQGGGDGASPEAGLINVGGTLYGTTYNGGTGTTNCSNGCGTVFSFNLSTSTETVLYSFQGSGNGSSDGAHPQASLTKLGIRLYGTTTQGGSGTTNCSSGCGTLFSINRKNVETVRYSFQGGSDGALPASGLMRMHNFLYGTTEFGGTGQCSGDLAGCGTVYSVTPTGGESVIYSFQGLFKSNDDGAYPTAALVNENGALWGTTSSGGDSACNVGGGCGVVFSLTTAGAEMIQWSFQGGLNDGATPVAPLIKLKHFLYGTTSVGGGAGCAGTGCGTVFEITPN